MRLAASFTLDRATRCSRVKACASPGRLTELQIPRRIAARTRSRHCENRFSPPWTASQPSAARLAALCAPLVREARYVSATRYALALT